MICIAHLEIIKTWKSIKFKMDMLVWQYLERLPGSEEQIRFGNAIRTFNEKDDRAGLIAFLENDEGEQTLKLLIPLYVEEHMYDKANRAIASLKVAEREKTGYAGYYHIIRNLLNEVLRVDDFR